MAMSDSAPSAATTRSSRAFDGTVGVVGRVMRTGKPELVKDVHADPEYRAASPDVRSEVSIPLRAGDTVIGVLNIESGQEAPPLDVSDLDTMVVVADRISVELTLAREREALRERAALFTRLADFGSAVNASPDPATAYSRIVAAVASALETDTATLVLRDQTNDDDRIVAIAGGDDRYVGVRIPPGEGLAGQAMAERRIVATESFARTAFATTLQRARAGVDGGGVDPLLDDDRVVGAISLTRNDLSRIFSALEVEAMPLIGSQVTLALANVELHARVADAAIRDPLTGLWNRRHLEVSTSRLFAARGRLPLGERRPIAIILFDLDHFGAFNKQHGHIIGDAVLRSFGSILSGRLRSSDIVARFGGEEFVAILDGATVEEAHRVADEIRRELESTRVTGADGESLRATVSAGCASLGPSVSTLEALLESPTSACRWPSVAGATRWSPPDGRPRPASGGGPANSRRPRRLGFATDAAHRDTRPDQAVPGGVTALDDLTVELEPGIIGLVGANGAGKSTFLRILLGLLPPTSGEASVLGYDVRRDGSTLRRFVGYMPESDCLPPDTTATDFVGQMARLSGLPRPAARERAPRCSVTSGYTRSAIARWAPIRPA